MCEILFHAKNNTHADSVMDRRWCYKRGMPVVLHEDGHTWGRLESKQQWIAEGNTAGSWPSQGQFVIIKIPGVTKAKALSFIDEQTEDDSGLETGKMFRRRRWTLLVDSLPQSVRNTMNSTGEYTTSVAAIRNYLKRIRDNAQYTGLD
jgi:hypothetical protein